MTYKPNEIEKKWAKYWLENEVYKAVDEKGEKSYLLIEFPYPSGERLHVGHARSYSCMDAVARKRRMQGKNVMFPFGWDAFGLPAENYAIKTGIHPSITTKKNIDNARKQAVSWGLSFDWSREINTTDPGYYKWTQWIFLQLYKHGLAYKEEIAVNWCPSCKINLANEEVIEGKCERCGSETNRRLQKQWLLKITKYADKLLKDLDTVDYRSDIKQQQINWIGRKEGINITYQIENLDRTIEIFTTRPDTNFGATFIVIAPEHELIRYILENSNNLVNKEAKNDIERYVQASRNKSELERVAEGKKKTGVFTRLYAINGLNGEKLPIWISDFVLSTVGTGAVVGVPGHDKRDFEFAKEFQIPIKRVVVGVDGDKSEITELAQVQEDEGVMINSGFLDGKEIHEATKMMMDFLEEKGWGKRVVTYHLRDWVFSRQHYWGEPIPMTYCDKCGWQPVPEDQLPVRLPEVEKYQPTDTGESPLAHIDEWVNTICPKCGVKARRETDTMPNWAGSSWYYLRYCDAQNSKLIASVEKLKYWLPVDWYNGGMEHTTLHLLYSRFWHKFLFDIGVVPTQEPYAKRTSHGVVLGPDGKRMSKSRGNVINPDEIVEKYGADTLRVYEMFIGPFDQLVVWNDAAVAGVFRFLNRVWDLVLFATEQRIEESSGVAKGEINKLISKIDSDLENMKFNTAVASAMEFVNFWAASKKEVGLDVASNFVKVLAPMAPFITEELWSILNKEMGKISQTVHRESWPQMYRDIEEDSWVDVLVQINGKLRDKLAIDRQKLDEGYIKQSALESAKLRQWFEGKKIIKSVWVEPSKSKKVGLLNLVVE